MEQQGKEACKLRELDADLLKRLGKAVFLVDFAATNTCHYTATGSGTYLEVGASEMIAAGQIKIKPGTVKALSESAVITDDGAQLNADVVVFATGYAPLVQLIEEICGKTIVERLGTIWGLGSERPGDPAAHECGGPLAPRRQPVAESHLLPFPRLTAQGPTTRPQDPARLSTAPHSWQQEGAWEGRIRCIISAEKARRFEQICALRWHGLTSYYPCLL